MANREACELWIEQEIETGLEEGKTPYNIGQEVSGWVAKLFEVRISPHTIRSRADRQKEKSTQMSREKPIVNSTTSNLEKPHGGSRPNSGRKPLPTFNETNDNIKWAKWTWNPVTGCKHGCEYCYARDIANRFYEEKFEPTFRPERLTAPQNTKIPAHRKEEEGINNVFVCSMADLFGKWVPYKWIEAVLKTVSESPQWTYIFLTKNPKRYIGIKFPKNCWLGATADTQIRATEALDVFFERNEEIHSCVHFLSCEPLTEAIDLNPDHYYEGDYVLPIDWLIVGGKSKNSQMSASQPLWEWVEFLWQNAREAGIPIYWKENLTVKPQEYPKV